MFAFAIWDESTRTLFAARDRFGVKPLYFNFAPDGTLMLASELKALLAAGAPSEPNLSTWANYFAHGLYDNDSSTFLRDLHAVPPGYSMVWRDGKLTLSQWYDLAERVGQEFDERSEQQISEEYMARLEESVRLRFRSDVPVGINLSGGLDSSTLLGLVQKFQGNDSGVKAYTFVTGDPRYDELPWVSQMLSKTNHPLIPCLLSADEVPALAESVQAYQDEPFGGLPTLAYARLFETARSEGTIVLLDGQGMDEQWAGYDYYANAGTGQPASVVQGSRNRPVRPDCLTPEFLAMTGKTEQPQRFPDGLRNLQYRDTRYTKIPRALRFNDRISMRASTELREPFLDHRLFELAFRQKSELKIRHGTGKWLLRSITKALLPQSLIEAPKRPLQTPQREWLRGPLKSWASDLLEEAIIGVGSDWLDADATRRAWREFCAGESDNSFYIWQWISLGLMSASRSKEICLN
jgi:asparagine synthase (glutamine-hydrolysing)